MDKPKIVKLSFILCMILLVTVTFATYLKSYTVNAEGRVVGIRLELYEDLNATTLLTRIDWGFIDPDETKSYTCYLKSKSNVPVYLTLTTENWNPINVSDYFVLSWDYDNATLQPNEIHEVTFNLYVASDISGIDTFSFDIVATAEKTGVSNA